MKRAIIWLAGILLCFSILACGKKEKDWTEGSVWGITVKINPEFSIGLDKDGKIIDVKALNSDAKKAFADVNVVDTNFEMGFRKLLDAIYEGGYIQSSSIEVSVTVKNLNSDYRDDSAIVNGLEKVTNEFSQQTNV